MKTHTHRAIKGAETIMGYSAPVADCEHQNPAAHGNICRTDRCRCGALRQTNVNQWQTERGPWLTA